jgi:hypothetical protein
MTAANERFLAELARPLSCAIDDYAAFVRGFSDFGIKGESVVNYLLNEQGKIFPMGFYNQIMHGHKFPVGNIAFGSPLGVLRGVLLRMGYQHYERKDNPDVVMYYPQSAQPPPGMIPGRPF